MPTAAHTYTENKVPNDKVQPGQFILLFLQDDPMELAKVSHQHSMFWGLVLKIEPTVTPEGVPVWYFTLLLENGSSIVHRRTTEFAYVATTQPSEFSDAYIDGKIAKRTAQIEALEAEITRLKAVQAAVQTS